MTVPINLYYNKFTCDRGSEFANWREIESALNCQMYFADPYYAWQKGTNEHKTTKNGFLYPSKDDANIKKQGIYANFLHKSLVLVEATGLEPK